MAGRLPKKKKTSSGSNEGTLSEPLLPLDEDAEEEEGGGKEGSALSNDGACGSSSSSSSAISVTSDDDDTRPPGRSGRVGRIDDHYPHSDRRLRHVGSLLLGVPYSAYKEFRIIQLPGLRTLNGELREDVLKLEGEIDDLWQEIGVLRPEAERATALKEELGDISTKQRCNVDRIVNLVKENEAILEQTRDNLRQRIVQDVIKIVMMSDKNNDGRFSRVETKFLVLKLSMQLHEYGVSFDEEKFYRVMSVDPSVTRTLAIVRRLIPPLDGYGDAFIDDDDDNDEDAYDMFHMEDDSSFTSASLSSSLVAWSSTDEPIRRLSLSLSHESPKAKRVDRIHLSPRARRGDR
eukprot:CAMPEP_0181122696 /NCGR_PEP_ID=MMETSP1071-20121207/25460_1 /TAXON_ID=35127 /ORGANISM="Thalassiosira sp., Strain NH16" /LENGTH=347 /DNA_ID=CAMNT_0023207701 /DNA_START=58 /DNA_END=1102 /DNA_ORIENTATION=+